MTLVFLAAAWLAGIAIASQVGWPLWIWALWAGVSLGLLIGLRRKVRGRIVAGCALLLALGAARMALVEHDGSDISAYNGQGFVEVEGEIIDAPEVRDAYITFRLKVYAIDSEGEDQATSGVVLVQAPNVTAYRYGEVLRVRGQLSAPEDRDDFAYREYLARQGVYSLMRYAVVEPTGERRGNPIRIALLDFRARAHALIVKMLPDPQASILAGILLGIESGISPDLREAFNAVGASHVIVISGSNLVIIAGLAGSLTRRFFNAKLAAVMTIASVLIYTAFVGGDPAVTRAAVMVSMGLVAAQLGRETYGVASLAFSAMLMTAINPNTLWDVGFQLSFAATLGLVLFVKPLQEAITRGLEIIFRAENAQKIVAALSDVLIVTIGAQIATTPLILYHFGRFSPYSLLVSLLIVPAQELLMIFGGLGLILGLVIYPIGQVFAWGSWVFLTWTIGVVELFAGLPGASTEIGAMSAATLAGSYAVICGIGWVALQHPDDRARWLEGVRHGLSVKVIGTTGVVSALVLFGAAGQMPDQRLHVSLLDVGKGSAVLIETPSGRHVLIDAGGSGRRLSAEVGAQMPFWDRTIDLVILTQPNSAHAGGLNTVLNRWQMDVIMTNGRHGESDLSTALWERVQEQGTREVVAAAGMTVEFGDGVVITVLQSDSGQEDGSGDPVVVMLTYGNLRMLIPGDLNEESQGMLMSSGQHLDAEVWIAPRGGHRDSTSEALVGAVTPSITLISPTDDDLPHVETLARLEAAGSLIYNVDERGTITLISDGQRLWIKTKR